MRIIKSSVEVLTPIDRDEILKRIEDAGRTCYKSEDKITENSASKFVKGIIKSGHESVIEHVNLSVRFLTNRGVTHEMVRHRHFSVSQESSRYADYTKDKFDNQVRFIDIKEGFPDISDDLYEEWEHDCFATEASYQAIKEIGGKTDLARNVLNNSTATEIVLTGNLRQWRHFLKLRTSKNAHAEIRVVANKLLDELREELPEVFGDINE